MVKWRHSLENPCLVCYILCGCYIYFIYLKQSIGTPTPLSQSLLYYASPSSVDAYSDWQLTSNFELWVEIFCVPTCFHMRIPKLCLFVTLKKKSLYLRQYQSYSNYSTNWYTNGKVFTSATTWKRKNLNFFSKKVEIEFWLVFCFILESWNHLAFVNISPTLVIDTRMERSSQVLYHEKSKNWFC